MAKQKTLFICDQCSYQAPKWLGQCPSCQAWGTLTQTDARAFNHAASGHARNESVTFNSIQVDQSPRLVSGIGEFDRVMGGGIVAGSVDLLGGEPGIGKSTLLLQVADRMGGDLSVVYVSGEESASQIKMRGSRLGLESGAFQVLIETRYEAVESELARLKPDLVIIDSIQTMSSLSNDSPPGSLSQVRDVAARLIAFSKPRRMTVLLVGHITKDGAIAGPKSLEHMVDGVFYFEGDKLQDLRLIRAQKNRFGPTGEVGIWRMSERGLIEVPNPSEILLAHRPAQDGGSAVVPCLEGTRPILVEIQVLTGHAPYASPRRLATGVDGNRLAMLLAVLEKKTGLQCAGLDVFANVVGGLQLREPAVDLGLAVALASSVAGWRMAPNSAIFGEIGLSGEVRRVVHAETRIRECRRMGFKRILCPKGTAVEGTDLSKVTNIAEALEVIRVGDFGS